MSFSDLFPLTQLPPFQLVTVDFAAEKASLLAGIKARYAANGITYDVGMIEGDSDVVLAEEFAFQKTRLLQTINDAGKRFSLAYSYGATLDHIAATYYADIDIRRLPLAGVAAPRPYAEHPEDWEGDDAFRERIALAPDARSPFTPGAYALTARSVSTDIVDAVALNFSTSGGLVARRGDILLVVLGKPGADEAALCAAVRAALDARPLKAETDTVMVQPARHVPVDVARTVEVLHGPDEALIESQATAGVAAYGAKIRRLGRLCAVSGIDAAVHVDGVVTVRQGGSPAADVDPGPDGVVEFASVTFTMEAAGD